MRCYCCECKHICVNQKYDGLLDCLLALEESGKQHCSERNYEQFEQETDSKIVDYYKEIFEKQNSTLEGVRENDRRRKKQKI